MKKTLARIISRYTRNYVFGQNPHRISSSFCLSPKKYWPFTSKSHDVTKQQPSDEEKKDERFDEPDVSNKELRKSIERFMKGDEEAIPSIFQAILKRKLAGKGEQSDDEELMKELRDLPPVDDVSSDKEFDSDHDEL